jgi:hypothetical protein
MLATGVIVLGLVSPLQPQQNRAPIVDSRKCATAYHPLDNSIGRRAVLSGAAVAALSALPMAAPAESTLVTRQQAYTRYVPRIERGRDFWANGLRKQIAAGDWAAILKELEPVGKKDKGGVIPKTFSPMRLWASSWSSKTISDKTVAMQAAIDELDEAAASLEIAALGKEKSNGLFSFLGGAKTLDEKSRMALASAAYKKGVFAFNKCARHHR